MRLAPFIIGILLTGCQPQSNCLPEPESPKSQRISLGIDYAEWPSVTEAPIWVPSELLMLCAAPTAEAIRLTEADKKQRGPHSGSAIVVRVNPAGLSQFKSAQTVPVGTIILKEKFLRNPSNHPADAIAVMIKREAGYDPKYGDWEYAYEDRRLEQDNRVVRDKLDTCFGCHQEARKTDYLFRTYLRSSP